jgi:signal transduction histidine kinase
MRRGSLTRWLITPVADQARIARADVLFAVVLSAFAVLSASGLEGSNAHNANAGWAAALAVLLMSSPVLLVRRWPVPVAAVLAVGAGLNWLVIGDLVRCGTGLLAVFYTAFVLGARCRIRSAAAGLGLLAVNIACQAYSDPQLGSDVIVYMVPIAVAFAAAGRLLASRNAVVAQLRTSTEQLRSQREETARLAVATEQARIAGHLDGFLGERVDRISGVATAGRASLITSPDGAREAFEEISRSGREALTRMRDVVADLADSHADAHAEPGGIEPAPVLAQLDRLLADAAEGQARLRVLGDPRLLPPGLELSAYRIVERLLEATDGDATAANSPDPVEVIVAFEPHELQLTVIGAIARRADVRAALAAVSERAAVHGGCMQTSTTDRRRTTVVALPLVAGHV